MADSRAGTGGGGCLGRCRDALATAGSDRFDTDTVVLYEQQFGGRVRTAHDLLTFRNMRDRDLDTFYRRPANVFQMRIVAQKLAFLSNKLERQFESER